MEFDSLRPARAVKPPTQLRTRRRRCGGSSSVRESHCAARSRSVCAENFGAAGIGGVKSELSRRNFDLQHAAHTATAQHSSEHITDGPVARVRHGKPPARRGHSLSVVKFSKFSQNFQKFGDGVRLAAPCTRRQTSHAAQNTSQAMWWLEFSAGISRCAA